MKSIKRVFFFFKIVVSVLKKKNQNKTGRHGDIHPVAQSMESSQAALEEPRPGGSPEPGAPECRGGDGRAPRPRGRGYLLQSLCSMLYTSSSLLRPSKNGMRSSSSVSVMSSNQDCTGTAFSGWKM